MKKLATLLLLLTFVATESRADLTSPGLFDASGVPIFVGQTTMSASLPIAISSNQSAIPVSQSGTWNVNSTGTSTVTQGSSPWVDNITQFGGNNVVTGTGASGVGIPRVTVSNDSNILSTQSGTWNLNNISGTISLPTGASTSALQTTGNTYLSQIATNTSASATDFTSTGSITTACSTGISCASTSYVQVYGQGVYTVTASVTGTWSGTLVAEGQLADLTWVIIPMYTIQQSTPYTQAFSNASNGQYVMTGGGYLQVRIRAQALASGSVSVALDGSLSQQTIFTAQLGNWNFSGSSVTNSGTISGNGNILALGSLQPYAGVVFAISGTWSSTLTVQGSNDGTNYFPVSVQSLGSSSSGPQSTITSNGLYYAPVNYTFLELVSSSYVSGTVSVVATFHAIPPAILNGATNVSQFGGTNVVTGTGASGSGIPRVTVSNDSNILATQSGTWSTRTEDGSGNSINSSQNNLYVAGGWSFKNLTATGTTTIKSGAGLLNAICFNNVSASAAFVLYDNTAASGTVIGTYTESYNAGIGGTYAWSPNCQQIGGAIFSTGLTINVTTAGNITIFYK